MSNWVTRLRVVLADHFSLAVLVCIALVVASGWFTYAAYGASETRTEVRQGPSWTTEGSFDHAATVTEPNEAYDEGTTLRNRSAYFAAVAPELDGRFTYGYAATNDGDLSVSMDATLVLQSVERSRSGEVETVYWRTERPLNSTTAAGLSPGERTTVSFAVNVSEATNRSERIADDLGGAPGETEALVRVEATALGTVNGEPVDRTDRYSLPIRLGDVYRVDDPGAVREKHSSTRTVAVADTGGLLQRVGAPVLFVASVFGLFAMAAARARGRLDPPAAVREGIAFEDARTEYDEWINTISLPANAHDLPRAEAESLADLVDYAIDTDNGVVEDPETETYYVVHDGFLYTYSPPTERGDGDPLGNWGDGEKRAGETADTETRDDSADASDREVQTED